MKKLHKGMKHFTKGKGPGAHKQDYAKDHRQAKAASGAAVRVMREGGAGKRREKRLEGREL